MAISIFAGPNEDLIKAVKSNNINNATIAINKGADIFGLVIDGEIDLEDDGNISKDMWKYLFLKAYDINSIKKSNHSYKSEILEMLAEGTSIFDEFLEDLIDEGTDINLGPFKGEKGYLELLEFLLKNGANPNLVFGDIIGGYIDEELDLNNAQDKEYIRIIRQTIALLLQYGADSNIDIGDEGHTPIMYALVFNELELAKLLLKYKANINAQDDNGNTYLHIIVDEYNQSKLEAIKFALNNGADVNIKDWENNSAFLLAVEDDNLELVKLFAQYRPKINDRGEDGVTPLMLAVDNENIEMVKFLLKLGADKNLKDSDSWRAIDYAKEYGYKEIENLLK